MCDRRLRVSDLSVLLKVRNYSGDCKATCGTLPCNENKLLTHTLQARCGTFTLLHCLAMRINSLLTRCEQRAVHYLAMRTNSPAHFRNCPTTIFVRLKQIASETNISLFPKPSPSTTLVLDKISKKSARPFANNKITRKFALAKEDGAIAQLVEQRTENPCVPGSIPGGTTYKKPRSTPARFFCMVEQRTGRVKSLCPRFDSWWHHL